MPHSYGVPITIVCTKADQIDVVAEELGFGGPSGVGGKGIGGKGGWEERTDWIGQVLRLVALMCKDPLSLLPVPRLCSNLSCRYRRRISLLHISGPPRDFLPSPGLSHPPALFPATQPLDRRSHVFLLLRSPSNDSHSEFLHTLPLSPPCQRPRQRPRRCSSRVGFVGQDMRPPRRLRARARHGRLGYKSPEAESREGSDGRRG